MPQDPFDRGLAEIEADRSHGAAELGRQGLALLARAAREADGDVAALHAVFRSCADRLAAVRPSMAPLTNLAQQWRDEVERLPTDEPDALRAAAAACAETLIASSRSAANAAAAHAAKWIGPDRTVMSHSLSSTVLATFTALRGEGVRAIVTESRPLNEGHDLARGLARMRIPVTLITDAQIGLFAGMADVVLVGADTVLPDGSVVNKVGTHPLALVARDAGIPVAACFESFKRQRAGQPAPELERMDPAELGAPALPGVEVANIYFEVTPARLVDAWITEDGVARPPNAP